VQLEKISFDPWGWGRKVKIWFPTINAGSGADIFTQRLAKALTRAGCETVITWIPHHWELLPRYFRQAPPRGTALIHANSWSAFAFVRHGLPTVATDHGFVGDPGFALDKRLKQKIYHRLLISRYVQRSFRECTAVTAVSNQVAKEIQPHCPNQVAVIQNWIDTDEFQPAPTMTDRVTFRVLYAGTTAHRKGFDVVQWLARQPIPNVELWCPRVLAKHLQGSSAAIHYYEKHAPGDMPSLYAQCDAVLMPSRYEGFGYVALEAMACARPVIGFACGGLLEICGESGGCHLVPVGDKEGLLAKLLQLAHDPDLLARTGTAGRQRAVDCFGESKAVEAYLSLYRSLLG
jgi:glycosyltransferase involved in cell wall biosynthesis